MKYKILQAHILTCCAPFEEVGFLESDCIVDPEVLEAAELRRKAEIHCLILSNNPTL